MDQDEFLRLLLQNITVRKFFASIGFLCVVIWFPLNATTFGKVMLFIALFIALGVNFIGD